MHEHWLGTATLQRKGREDISEGKNRPEGDRKVKNSQAAAWEK
jgi:hypothetical protein